MIRQGYLSAATVATGLMADPAVARSWDAPSALRKFRVSGLTGHLASQITQVLPVLDADPPDTPPISLRDHYDRSTWTDGDIDSELNAGIRRSGDESAAIGVAMLHAQAAAALAELQQRLPAVPADRVIQLPWGPWALTLDDFLTTRVLELAVHCDDLAVSVGVETPAFPPPSLEMVLDLLCRWAASRHGGTAVLRALSRAERAPARIAAL
jgi:hypothetical protein